MTTGGPSGRLGLARSGKFGLGTGPSLGSTLPVK